MMCASWSGQTDAVRLLLHHGAAWVGVVDTAGRDAKDLAVEGKSAGISKLQFSSTHLQCLNVPCTQY